MAYRCKQSGEWIPLAKARIKKSDVLLAKLMTTIKPTIVTANPEWGEDIPEWLIERIRIQRFIELFRELRGEKITEASDEEAFAYLYTASLVAPLKSEWVRIYLYLGYKISPEYMKKKIESLDPPKELTDYEKYLLQRLKSYIYEVRKKRERERIREIVKEVSKNRSKKVEQGVGNGADRV